MDKDFFSIIIPTYNSGSCIGRSVESVLGQTYSNYEILIVDGLSKDNTVAQAQSYNDDRIRIYSENDKGIYDAMNKGVALARGTWIYFLGSDDQLFANDILARIAGLPGLSEYDVVYGNVFSDRFNGLYDGIFNHKKIFETNICHQAIFIRKVVFRHTGLFNLRYQTHADWDHNMHWMLNGHIKKKFIDLTIANYADGGFSSGKIDFQFKADKTWNYSVYNSKNVSVAENIRSFTRELSYSWQQKHYRNCLRIVKQMYKLFI